MRTLACRAPSKACSSELKHVIAPTKRTLACRAPSNVDRIIHGLFQALVYRYTSISTSFTTRGTCVLVYWSTSDPSRSCPIFVALAHASSAELCPSQWHPHLKHMESFFQSRNIAGHLFSKVFKACQCVAALICI
jgi:hypothetical protein